MEIQGSPLLNPEISGFDINDEAKTAHYTKEIGVLYEQIFNDLSKIDTYGTGKVSENGLLNYLQSKLPPKRQLNVSLFQQLFEDLEREEDTDINLSDFTKKYIQAHEELKLNFDTLKKGFDKEKNLRINLQQKIQDSKQEELNKNGMSPNSCVSTEIGKLSLLSQIDAKELYFSVSLDNKEEKKTDTKNIKNPTFIEKFTFHIDSKESILSYKLYSTNQNECLGEVEVPLYILNLENEELTPDFEIKDDNSQTIAVFKPKIIIVTSYYDMYQRQYDNIEKNIESYQSRIAQLSETLADISLPYKKEFDDCVARTLKAAEEDSGKLIKGVEGVLRGFGAKDIKFEGIYKGVIYFCIFTQLFTSMTKPDFISLFIEITLGIIINTGMTDYLSKYFTFFFSGVILGVCFDIFDYLFISAINVESMSAVNGWVKFFSFLGFLGKLALLYCTFVIRKKYGKNVLASSSE